MTEKAPGAQFRLRVQQDSSQWEFMIEQASFTLGRTNAATAVVPIQILSSIHLEFVHQGENNWNVFDKRSTNGTSIGRIKMEAHKPYPLTSPMQLRVGKATELKIEIEELQAARAEQATAEPVKAEVAESILSENLSEPALEVPLRKPFENKESLEQELLLVEAKLQQAKSSEHLQRLQAQEAEKILLQLDEQKRAAELQLVELQQDHDKQQVQSYEINQRLESQRKDYDDRKNKLTEIEIDIRETEKKLTARVEEKKEVDRNMIEIQRKVSALIEQERELKKVIEMLKSEAAVFRAERDEKKRLHDETQAALEEAQRDHQEKLDTFQELKEAAQKHESRLQTALEKESEAHRELHKSLRMISDKESELQSFSEKIENAVKELDEKRQALEQLGAQGESLRQALSGDERERQVLSQKLESERDAYRLAESQRKASEAAFETLRAEVLASEGRLKRIGAETQEKESRLSVVSSELQTKEKLSIELAREIDSAKAEFDNWLKTEQAKINGDIEAKKKEFAEWEKAEKERLQAQYGSKSEKFERELSERKQKEFAALEETRAQLNRERDVRRPLEIKEIVRSAGDILAAHLPKASIDSTKQSSLVDAFRKDLEDVVRAVLTTGNSQVETHLKSMLVQSPEQTIKAKKDRRIWAMQAGVGLMTLVICLVFPDIPRSVWQSGVAALDRSPQSQDQFVQRVKEARANRPRFMPNRDQVYRNTYTDNLIYLQDYAEIKNDEEIKKAWTLELNKFFVDKLELDEKVIVTYMGIEAPLVKDLTEMAQKIEVSTQQADLSRMHSFEEQIAPRLEESVKGKANYDKVREFELEFYKRYSNKIK